MKKILSFVKKYLADIIIQVGVAISSYNILRIPTENHFGLYLPKLPGTTIDYHTGWKVLGIILISIGINVAIKKYLQSKKI